MGPLSSSSYNEFMHRGPHTISHCFLSNCKILVAIHAGHIFVWSSRETVGEIDISAD